MLFLAASVSGQCVNLTDISSYASKINNISGVFYINQNTTLCTQTYDFTSSSDDGVLRFNNSNIFLDCNNSLINGSNLSSSYGIYLPAGMGNNTVVNCTVKGYFGGVYINSSNNILLNSTLENDFYGIYLDSNSTNSVIQDSRARYNKHGIYSNQSCNNTFKNISASYNDWYGFQLTSSHLNSFIDITAHNNSQGFIHLFSSINNSFRNVDARENNQSVYFYHGSSNNLFIDSVLNQSTTSDVYVDSSFPVDCTINNTFINVSFNNISFNDCEGSSDVCLLRVKWYAMVQVNYSNQTPVSGASVNVYNNSDTLIDSGVTGSTGFTRFNLTGFDVSSVSSGVFAGDRNNHSNYTINVFDGVYNHSILVNPVSNSWIPFILGDCTTYCSSCGDCSAAIKTANPGDVICLDSNITNASTSFCINVSTNNITFSCQGNRVDGNH
ncbi:MAG: right-handed parallel beta-helix repeat-containing protein, partial [Candidatus Altiarchaeota archaeon]|nr:right-handed parallel beta-helix repeat-containing protein [Candidatus Altiarchaeota archaeon]